MSETTSIQPIDYGPNDRLGLKITAVDSQGAAGGLSVVVGYYNV